MGVFIPRQICKAYIPDTKSTESSEFQSQEDVQSPNFISVEFKVPCLPFLLEMLKIDQMTKLYKTYFT